MATHADMVGELREVRQGRPVGTDVRRSHYLPECDLASSTRLVHQDAETYLQNSIGALWGGVHGDSCRADVYNRVLIGASHCLGIDERCDSDRGLRCPRTRAIRQ
jgi:hypothetical protein